MEEEEEKQVDEEEDTHAGGRRGVRNRTGRKRGVKQVEVDGEKLVEEKEEKQNTHEPPIQAAVEMQRSGEDASTNKSSLSIEK